MHTTLAQRCSTCKSKYIIIDVRVQRLLLHCRRRCVRRRRCRCCCCRIDDFCCCCWFGTERNGRPSFVWRLSDYHSYKCSSILYCTVYARCMKKKHTHTYTTDCTPASKHTNTHILWPIKHTNTGVCVWYAQRTARPVPASSTIWPARSLSVDGMPTYTHTRENKTDATLFARAGVYICICRMRECARPHSPCRSLASI